MGPVRGADLLPVVQLEAAPSIWRRLLLGWMRILNGRSLRRLRAATLLCIGRAGWGALTCLDCARHVRSDQFRTPGSGQARRAHI